MSLNKLIRQLMGKIEKSGSSKTVGQSKPGQEMELPLAMTAGSTQFPGAHEKLPWQQFIVGLDFGTAFTKIVISESRIRYAIPVGLLNGDTGFCLPCAVYVGPEGQVSLRKEGSCTKKKTNLKMPLIEETYDREDLKLVVAYLALVFRLVRLWFITEYFTTYIGKYLDWNINVGLPTEKFHDEEMVELYKTIIRAAWFLSTEDGDITLRAAGISIEYEKFVTSDALIDESSIHSDKVNCFPEFVALVSGYVRSPRRQDDLHLLVDIGAGTVDVTIFNVHQDENQEDIFPIFAKGVQALGTSYLLKNRFLQLNIGENVDSTQPILNDQLFASKYKTEVNQISLADEVLCKRIKALVGGELRRVKKKRYRKSSQWEVGVPCFVSGGGKDLTPYQGVLQKMSLENYPFRIKLDELPFPGDLKGEGLERRDFHRLLVAYGLSVDPFDIGKIIKSQDVPDDDEPDPDDDPFENRYVCKEMT